jgi:hypothetical protein
VRRAPRIHGRPARLFAAWLLMIFVLALAPTASPSDVMGTISPGGSPVTVTISTANDNARISFDGTAGQRIFVNVTGVTIGLSTCCSVLASILRPDGTTMNGTSTYVGTNGGYIDRFTLPSSGTYAIYLDPQGTATGSATLTAYDVPVDAGPTMQPGQTGTTATLTTTVPGQNVAPTFSGTAGQRVFVTVTGVTIGPSTCCSILASFVKPDGTTMNGTSKYIGTNGGFLDTVTLPTSGTYRVLLDVQAASTGSATLTTYDVPADPAPALDLSDDIVWSELNTTVPGQNIAPTFSGTAGQRVFVNLPDVGVGTSTCCSLLASIVKPDGATLSGTSKYIGTSGGYLDTVTLPTTGTYTILVDPQANATGAVSAGADSVPADAQGSVAIGDAALTMAVTMPGQDMNVTYQGSSGQAVKISLSAIAVGASTCCGMLVSVKKPDGSTLVSAQYVGTNGATISANLPVDGTYTIFASPDGANIGTAAFGVNLNGAPQNTAAPAITGTTANGDTLTASPGSWSGSPTSYSYQWQRCDGVCEDVVDAQSSTYTLGDDDTLATMRVVVTAANSVGPAGSTSWPTAEVTGDRLTPKKYTRSFYVNTTNPPTWYDLGCALGHKVGDGSRPRDASVFLNFGRPYYSASDKAYGALNWSPDGFRKTKTIRVNVLQQFGYGYWACSPFNTKLILVAGTSNDGSTTGRAHGVAWANMVDATNAYFRKECCIASQVIAVGGIDSELNWNTAGATRRWVDGYDSATPYSYYVDGAAEGCPPAGTCDNGWSDEDIYYVNWWNKPAWPFPQIYNEAGTNATQWQRISAFGVTNHGSKMVFRGAMSQLEACADQGNPSVCSGLKNTPVEAWNQLRNAVNANSSTKGTIPYATDIRWDATEAP